MIPLETEEWRTVVINGEVYEDYEVSNKDGKIRSLKFGRIRLLKQTDDGHGYLFVGLSKNGKVKVKKVHRIVAETWIPNPNNYSDVDHIDRNRQNNSVENLRWLPHKNNIPINPTEKKILCVETGVIYKSFMDAERETGIPTGNICKVCQGKRRTAGGFHWEFVN